MRAGRGSWPAAVHSEGRTAIGADALSDIASAAIAASNSVRQGPRNKASIKISTYQTCELQVEKYESNWLWCGESSRD